MVRQAKDDKPWLKIWLIKDYYETLGKLAFKNECRKWAQRLSRDNFGGINNWRLPTLRNYDSLIKGLGENKTFPREPRSEYWTTSRGSHYYRFWAKNSYSSPESDKLNCRLVTTEY